MRMKTNRNKIVSFAADFKKEYEKIYIGVLMMFLFINISLAQTADTAVKSDELQTTTTSVDEVGVAPTDSTPTLSKKDCDASV